MARVRTLPESIRLLHEVDSGSAFTLTALRRMVKQGQVTVIEAGSKKLINFDNLLDTLSASGTVNFESSVTRTGEIRRIDENLRGKR